MHACRPSVADKCAAAEARAAAADGKIGRLEELTHTLQKEVAGKGSSLGWLEDQLAAARKEAASRKLAAAEALQEVHGKHAEERAVLERAAAAAEQAAEGARQEAVAMRQRRAEELGQIEIRFKALLQAKDGTIASLTQQLQELNAVLS